MKVEAYGGPYDGKVIEIPDGFSEVIFHVPTEPVWLDDPNSPVAYELPVTITYQIQKLYRPKSGIKKVVFKPDRWGP